MSELHNSCGTCPKCGWALQWCQCKTAVVPAGLTPDQPRTIAVNMPYPTLGKQTVAILECDGTITIRTEAAPPQHTETEG